MKKIFIIFFTALLFISCQSTYKYDINNPSRVPLEKETAMAIAVSEDGSYGSDIYNGSGRVLSNAIRQQLKRYTSNAIILKNNESLKDFSLLEKQKRSIILLNR